MTVSDSQCSFPPHPGPDAASPMLAARPGEEEDLYDDGPGLLAGLGEWRRESPLARSVPMFAPFAWTAAEVMHACHVAAVWPGGATAAATVLAAACGAIRYKRDPDRLSGGEAALAAAIPGAWITAAAAAGPLAGGLPWWWTVAGTVITGGMWWRLAGHRGIRTRRFLAERAAAQAQAEAARAAEWEAAKRWWNGEIAPLLGLTDYYLIHREKTLLGVQLEIGTSPSGKTARTVMQGKVTLADRLLAYLGLDFGAVDFDLAGPTRLKIRIRYGDPWAEPIWHPAFVPDSPYARYCPEEASIADGICVGVDPETGRPMMLTLWDQHGAKVVAVFAKKDGGKTTFMDSTKAGITACDDARLIQLNLSKAIEDSWWAELADANALDLDIARAFGILRFTADGITERPRTRRRTKVLRPTRSQPLYVITVDEIGAAIKKDPVRAQRLLGLICATCRSEGFAVILAGQRGIQAAIGGGEVQMNIDIVAWGKFAKLSELVNIFGREAMPPDMGEYGGGNPGVFGITSMPFLGEYQRGRAFYWGETCDGHEAVVARRRERRRNLPGLEPALARLGPQWARITAPGEYDWRADPEYAGSGTAPGDMIEAANGDLVPGVRAVKEKIAAAVAAADEEPDLTPLDGAGRERLRGRLEEEARTRLADYIAVKIPDDDDRVIRGMLATGVISSGDVAAAIGKSRATAHRYLVKLAAAGVAEKVEGRAGSQGGYRAARRLRVVNDGGDA